MTMKTNKCIYAIAALLLVINFAACTNSNEPDGWKVTDDPIVTTLKATITNAINTRVSMTEGSDQGIVCKWAQNDKFRLIYGFEEGVTQGTEQAYTLETGIGESTGTFKTTDTHPTGNGVFLAFYPDGVNEATAGQGVSYNDLRYNNDQSMLFFYGKAWGLPTPTQNASAPLDHIIPYHCLGAAGRYTDGQLGEISFKPIMSVISFNITTSSAITPVKVNMKMSNTDLPDAIACIVNSNGELAPYPGDSYLYAPNGSDLNLSDYNGVTSFTVNFFLPMQDASSNKFILTVTDDAGMTYQSAEFNGVNIAAGKRYFKDVTATKVVTYAVGDLYPDATNPVGVVCTISDGGVHGKVVNIQETSRLAWSSVKKHLSASSADGAVNMSTIQNESDWGTNYPAFKWCADLTPSNGKKWYLLSKDELIGISSSLVTINGAITSAGGATIGGYYWSSNDDSADDAHYVCLDSTNPTGNGRSNIVAKSTDTATIRIRAFLAF